MQSSADKLPEIMVFAGPNGSGKSTITALFKVVEPYINADEIKRSTHCSDMEAAQAAERMREDALAAKKSFSFETVLSTDRNLRLLERAKCAGYFIRVIYVLTEDPRINILRIQARVLKGGHAVPDEKVITRYHRALKLIPSLLDVCDICHIYDNTDEPYRIFKKRKDQYFYWENSFWDKAKIERLTNIRL